MKHRSGKIKLEHHLIPGLRELLREIEPWEEVPSLVPGRIKRKKSSAKTPALKIQYETPSGLKCLAQASGCVQEVFITSLDPVKLRDRLLVYLARR